MTAPHDTAPDRFDLEFSIPPDLYKRAITQPIPGREPPTGARMFLRVALTIAFATGSIVCFSLAFFDWDALAPMGFGFALGAAIVLGVWWRQHRSLVGVHMNVNARAERHHYVIDAGGVTATREHVRSEIGWPFVTAIRSTEGATLIEVQTARLIIPDAALDIAPDAFRARLESWWQA
ncbi:MAG: hypothetical protein AAGL23_10965 [Pseudomonadota bacterium]